MTTNVAIDIGNSSIKIGIFSSEKILEVLKLEHTQLKILKKILTHANHSIISSVKKEVEPVLKLFPNEPILLDHTTALPFKIDYQTPQTLGLDRIAAVAGARQLFSSGTPLLCIDIGTCITYDILDKYNVYQGGAISPGESIRLKGMHNFTDQLPLVDQVEATALIGKSTINCIQSGVYNGIQAEITEIIRMYESKFAHLQIVICGGGSTKYYFEKDNVLNVPDLVLYGLNGILKHNVK